MKRYMVLLAVVGLLLAGRAFAVSPIVVTTEVGICEETTFTATYTGSVSNAYLVVDDGSVESILIPNDGAAVSISVGPFKKDTTVYWRVFGGAERDYDIPSWNGYGTATFGADIVNYASSVGGYGWVLAGTDDPNPFTTWNTVEVGACVVERVATLNGGGHILEEGEEGSKRKDWLDVGFAGWVSEWTDGSLQGQFQVNLHNVGNDSLDGSKFHGSDVVELNLYEGNGTTCDEAANVKVTGTFNGEPGYIIFRAGDNGSPNATDTIRIEIYDASGKVYDTHNEFSDESNCVGTARTSLDTGNYTIWQK